MGPETIDSTRALGPRIRFALAEPEHDAALRRLSAVPMRGALSISLQREPSYLEASAVEGGFRQILIAVDRADREVVGMGSRSVRSRYLNGAATPVGYLGALRCARAYRGRTVLARGYSFLEALHGDGRASLYLTAIAADNAVALKALSGRRCGLPSYEPAGAYHTLAIPARRRRRVPLPSGVHIRPAAYADLGSVVAFLQRMGATRQFAPQYELGDFLSPDATFRDLRPQDIRLAFRGEEIVGALASWGQGGFKQTVVSGYGGALRWLRPVHNLWAGLRGAPTLPAAGTAIPHRVLALPFVEGNDAGILRALLDLTLDDHARRAAREPSCRLSLLGLHESDPLLEAARPYGKRTYESRLFVVHWADGQPAYDALDERPVYVELGCL